MDEKFTTFERRMKILSILINQPIISRLELARKFSVSASTICEDIISLSTVVPIASKMGRYGGIYIIEEYKCKKAYLSREEENLLSEISKGLTGKEKDIMEMILLKFSLPKAGNHL